MLCTQDEWVHYNNWWENIRKCSTEHYCDDVRQFVQLQGGIDTMVLKLTNFLPMTLSSGPTPLVLLLQDPVLMKVLTLMLDVVWTLFNYWTLFYKLGLLLVLFMEVISRTRSTGTTLLIGERSVERVERWNSDAKFWKCRNWNSQKMIKKTNSHTTVIKNKFSNNNDQ